MAKRMYSATFDEIAVTAVQDLMTIRVTSVSYSILIHSISVSQSSDVGDAAAEHLNLLGFKVRAGGSGGTVITPAPMLVGDSAFSGTVTRNNTTQASKVSSANIFSDSWNIFQGYRKVFSPNERPLIEINNSDGAILNRRFILALETAPADSLTMSCTIVFEEI